MAKESSVRRRGLSQISIAVLLLLLLGALAACGDGGDTTDVVEPTEVMEEPTEVMEEPTEVMEEPTEVMEEPGAGTAGGFVTLSDVADDPDAYMGQTVTVTGEASEILGPQVFRMNEGNLLDIGDEILVVHTEDQAPADLAEDTNIRVTGTVRTFVETEIEQDFDFDFDEELYVEYEERVAIVADNVEPIATVSNINEQPESYYGQEVTVIGDVVEMESTYAFELDDPALLGGDTILVVGGEDLTVTEGETVQVTGTVRQFNLTEVESETGFDLEDELFTDFGDRPAIVASSVSVTEAEATAGDTEVETPMIEDAEGFVTLSDVADDPDAYMGQTVTVTGEASEILGPQVFRMNEGNLLDIGDEILVVHTEDQAPADLAEDTNIRVTGTVRTFVEAEIEQDFDFDFDEELYVEYEERVAIVADNVEPIATVSNINEDPESYYGQEVTVTGDVVELESTYAFELDDPALLGGDTLLVVGGEDLTVTEGETVQVTGTVRQFNLTEIESETGFDLEDELFIDFGDRPVIVASSVSMAPDTEMEETQ